MGRRLPVYPYGLWNADYMGNCHIYQLLFTQKKFVMIPSGKRGVHYEDKFRI